MSILNTCKPKWFVYSFFILIPILFIWLTTIAISPYNKVKEIQQLVEADSIFNNDFDNINSHIKMAELLKERAFKQSLLKLSEGDSIQLVVNLQDSIVNLSIKGINIHQSKIKYYSKDPLFTKLSIKQHIKLLSEPIPITSIYSTIVKEPIVVRQAPKDTLEASLNAYKPDTLIQKPAFAAITTKHNLKILLEQDINSNSDRWVRCKFKTHLTSEKWGLSVLNLFMFKKQEYIPEIRITIPADDIRAIYRALPNQAFVAINL